MEKGYRGGARNIAARGCGAARGACVFHILGEPSKVIKKGVGRSRDSRGKKTKRITR